MGVGKAKGSMGNVTYTTDKAGRTIGRQKPVEVANPRSEGQTFNRTRLAIVQLIASGMLSLLNSFRSRAKANVAPYSDFIGYVLKLQGWATDTVLELAQQVIQYFRGSLEPFSGLRTDAVSFDNVTKEIEATMGWDAHAYGNGLATDTIKLVLINMSKGRVEAIGTTAVRSAGTKTQVFTLAEPADIYQIAALCTRPNNSLWANSGSMIYYESGAANILV